MIPHFVFLYPLLLSTAGFIVVETGEWFRLHRGLLSRLSHSGWIIRRVTYVSLFYAVVMFGFHGNQPFEISSSEMDRPLNDAALWRLALHVLSVAALALVVGLVLATISKKFGEQDILIVADGSLVEFSNIGGLAPRPRAVAIGTSHFSTLDLSAFGPASIRISSTGADLQEEIFVASCLLKKADKPKFVLLEVPSLSFFFRHPDHVTRVAVLQSEAGWCPQTGDLRSKVFTEINADAGAIARQDYWADMLGGLHRVRTSRRLWQSRTGGQRCARAVGAGEGLFWRCLAGHSDADDGNRCASSGGPFFAP